MEFKVGNYEIPSEPSFNFGELKADITEKTQFYSTIAYDDTQIKEAKADKANLNKLKKALNDERIRIQKEYMQPFDEFKSKVDELIKIIDEPVAIIDKQIKEFNTKKEEEKTEKIKALFGDITTHEFLKLSMIWNPRWLNSSFTLKKIEEEITEINNRITADLETLAKLDAFSFEAIESYKRTLDLGGAIAEGQRLADIQKRKEEAEAERKAKEEQAKAEFERRAKEEQEKAAVQEEIIPKEELPFYDATPPEEEVKREWVNFSAFLSVEEAQDLKWFFETKNIDFKAI